MPEALIRLSWASLARKYPFRGRRSRPTIDNARWCCTPAAFSAARRLRPAVSKNSREAWASNEGEFATSTTTRAPARTPGSPSPVRRFTPDSSDAATTSLLPGRSRFTSFVPIRPLPPMTTIFIACSRRRTRQETRQPAAPRTRADRRAAPGPMDVGSGGERRWIVRIDELSWDSERRAARLLGAASPVRAHRFGSADGNAEAERRRCGRDVRALTRPTSESEDKEKPHFQL